MNMYISFMFDSFTILMSLYVFLSFYYLINFSKKNGTIQSEVRH